MKILHIGWGFRPFRVGGLIEYAEDLMEAQATQGDSVAYFFAGRHYPLLKRPWLRRWNRRGVEMHEIINSRFCLGFESGTRQPSLALAEPDTEGLFRRVLSEFKPEVVHIHELTSLPSSVIDITKDAGVPTLMTLQDYFALCPTLKLIDSDGAINLQRIVGDNCVRCSVGAPRDFRELIFHSFDHDEAGVATRLPQLLRPVLRQVKNKTKWLLQRRRPGGLIGRLRRDIGSDTGSAERFQQRRDTNVSRLNRIDCVIAQSNRVNEIYRELGVQPDRLQTLHLTLAHLDRIVPAVLDAPPRPVRFVTLNGCAYPTKGAHLIAAAVRDLNAAGLQHRFELVVYGGIMRSLQAELLGHSNVVARGSYAPENLNEILSDSHVGLMPSTWEEAYGYAGVELIAKGIPVIGNAIGGIVDYVEDGVTGWLNRQRTSEGLVKIMKAIIEDPGQIVALNQKIRARHREIVKPFANHVAEMNEIYAALLRERRKTGRD